MTNTRNPFRPRPLSFAIASVLTLGAASAETGLDTAGERAKAREPFPLCTPGLEKTAGTGGLALYELGNGEFVADYALGDAAEKCLKGTAAGYTIRLDGQTFNLAGSGGQVVVVRPPVANAPRVVEADSINPALCESYFDGTNGYALELTDANGDLLGGGSLPGILSVGFNPGNGQFTPVVMAAVHAPYIQCYDATEANIAIGAGDAFFSDSFESGADLRVSFLDESGVPLANDELLTTIGSNSVYQVRVSNAGSSAANDVRIREFLPRAGGYLSPAMSAIGCSADTGSPACTTGASGALAVDIPSLAGGQSVVYTLERLVAGSVDLPAASGALTAVAAFVDPDSTRERNLADNARHLRIGLQSNAPPVADPKSVSTPEDTAVAVLLSGSDTDGTVQGYAIASGPQHGDLSGDAPNLTYEPNPDYNGPDSFTYTVIDDRGTASAPATVSITVNPLNDGPEVALQLPNVERSEGDPPTSVVINVAGAFTDPEGDDFTVEATGLPPGLTYFEEQDQGGQWTRVITGGLGLESAGIYTVVLTATETGTGLTGVQDFTFTVINLNQPPVVASPLNNVESDEGDDFTATPLNLAVHFDDADSTDTLTFSVTDGDLPDGLSLSLDGEVSGIIDQTTTGAAPTADFNIEITADDGQGGTVSGSFVWTVNRQNAAPVLTGTPIPDQQGSTTSNFFLDGSFVRAAFSDPDGAFDVLRYRSSTLPPGLSINEEFGTIFGTPTDADQVPYTVTIEAFDQSNEEISAEFNMLISS